MIKRSGILIALALGLFAIHWSVSAAQSGSQDPGGEVCQAPTFVPKISLAQIRFGFRGLGEESDTIFCELIHPQPPLFHAVYDSGLDRTFDRFLDSLDPQIQAKVLSMIPESLGDAFVVIEPATMAHSGARLKALSYMPTGDGSFSDFAMILAPDTAFPPSHDVFLVIPGEWADKIQRTTHSAPRPTETDLHLLSNLVARHADDQSATVLKCHPIQLKRNEPAWAAEFVTDGGAIRLACFRQHHSGRINYSFIPFDDTLHDDLSGDEHVSIVLEDYTPEAGNSMVDSSLIVLPDLDGNGCSELLVISDSVYRLMSIDHEGVRVGPQAVYTDKYHVRSVRERYFGC